ncbi:hypothetical protein I7V34_18175 [Bacillus sp. V3]|nr:hypothetical protein I7V34_18175 [Bacillus sp. V3]
MTVSSDSTGVRTDMSFVCVRTKRGALFRERTAQAIGFYRNGPGDHD